MEIVKKKSGKEILVIGNGDVLNLEDGILKAKESGADGVMLGRAIFGNPWLFNSEKTGRYFNKRQITGNA